MTGVRLATVPPSGPSASLEVQMPEPRVFVSFDLGNSQKSARLFVGHAASHSPRLVTIHGWSRETALPPAEAEESLRSEMASVNTCIVLVGWATATAPSVAREIAVAKHLDVPVFGVYVDGAGASALLPAGLQRSRTVAWRWDLIATAVNQAMGEGKNT